MMSGALMADAAIGNVQERTLKSFNALNTEMVGSFHLFFFSGRLGAWSSLET